VLRNYHLLTIGYSVITKQIVSAGFIIIHLLLLPSKF